MTRGLFISCDEIIFSSKSISVAPQGVSVAYVLESNYKKRGSARIGTSMMEGLFIFWEKRVPVSKEGKDFFRKHGVIKTYKKGSLLSQPDRNVETWSFVLEGLVAGVHYPEKGGKQIRWFAPPKHYFTSTAHLFTRKKTEHIEVLQDSTILNISRTIAQEGQQKQIAISELFHILLQQRIKQYRNYIHLMQEENSEERYVSFIKNMPEIVAVTTQEQHCQYLRMSNGSYYAAKKAYLKRRIY